MYETQVCLDLKKIQDAARALAFAGYQVKEIFPADAAVPSQHLSSLSPTEEKIKLLPTVENLAEIRISFSAEKQELFIVTSTDAGYAFAKNLCDELEKKFGQIFSRIMKINPDFLKP